MTELMEKKNYALGDAPIRALDIRYHDTDPASQIPHKAASPNLQALTAHPKIPSY